MPESGRPPPVMWAKVDTGLYPEIEAAIGEVFPGESDRVRKDCPELPEWKINTIAGDVFHMLLDRSVEFLFPDPPEE